MSSLSSRTTLDPQLFLSVCVSHSVCACNAGIPAVRPNNKGCAPCLWTITSSACPYMELCIAEARKKGVCLLTCVTARCVPGGAYFSGFERVCWSKCSTKGCGRGEGEVLLDVCNVWNIWPVWRCSGGRAVGEERQGVRVTVFPPGSCQHQSFIQPRREEKKNRLAKLMRKCWKRICNWNQS